MKLNKLFGAALAVAATLSLASAVYAEDTKVALGNPIDLDTGKAVEAYTAGQHIAVPVEVYSATSGIKSFGVDFSFDTDAFTFGIDTLTTNDNNTRKTLKGLTIKNSAGTTNGAFAGIRELNEDDAWVKVGSWETNEKSTGVATLMWAHKATISTSEQTEGYVLFTVKKPVEALNTPLFTITNSTVGDLSDSNVTSDSTTEKANVCEGAFQIVVDSSKLKTYIHGVSVVIDGVETPLEYVEESGDKYTFPVRLVKKPETADKASLSVSVIAKVADTDAADATTKDASLGNINVTLNAPTSYAGTTLNGEIAE